MKARRIIALALALVFAFGTFGLVLAFGAPAASAAGPSAPQEVLSQTNEVVSIRLTPTGTLVYGSPMEVTVKTTPEDTQYIAVVLGTGGEARGYVTLLFSEKIRTLLKLIPLPRVMSATPDQEEEFNVYQYIKQLIDGNDVDVLLRVADEVASVMDVLKFYVPTLNDVSFGLKLALNLIRRYLPDDIMTHIYVDEQPTDAGNYVAGAVALDSGDINTAGVAMFTVKPRSGGVRMYWASDAPATMTLEQAAAFNPDAVLEVGGQVLEGGKISYVYKKKDAGFFSDLFAAEIDGFPTEPGEYIQTAKLGGNYTCSDISRTLKITG